MSLDPFRYQVGEISEIIFIDEHGAAYKRPSEQSDIVGFVKPFTPLVWVLVLVLLLMVLVAFSLLSFTQHSLAILPTPTTRNHGVGGGEVMLDGSTGKQEPNPPKHNINRDAVIWTVCSLLAQSVPLKPPRGVVKSVTGLWLLLSLILASVYRSNLKAMLILPKVTLPFNNLEELVNAGLPVWTSLDSLMHRSVYFADPNSLLGGLNRTIYNVGQPNNTTWGALGLIEGAHAIAIPRYSILQVMNSHFSKRNVDDVPDAWQEEFLDLKNDSAAKDAFQNMELEEFWTLVRGTYPLLATNALRILVQFSSTYLCETGFSALVHLKTKARSKLEVEADLRCALSITPPDIEGLVKGKQCQKSH
ncbi:hypothetical protein Pmani_001179 [Petrolisthes manimaculis]|uniref:Ionotropic glutamate receptor C-terminal domain-containing protein n=1 Tax=Petrolisthes manimaculis TaxID=1843537 RepID=A0AAE1UPN3_9EUCA|nr:hypothetical protein Pmani_001179 [Petrolisthes manimaculis]